MQRGLEVVPERVGLAGSGADDPAEGLTVDFVVESVPSQLTEIADRVQDGHLHTHIGTVATLDDAIPALNPVERRKGKAVIHAHP